MQLGAFQFLCLVLLSCELAAQQPASAVSMFRGNPQLTGVYDTQPVYKLNGVKFTFRTQGPLRASPAVADGLLFFGSGDGAFYAIDAQTGKERWRFQTGDAVHSSPAVANGVVFFTSRDRYLYALGTRDGKERWKYRMGEDVGTQNYWDYFISSPNIIDGRLYVGSGDGNLYAFDLNTHKVVWKYDAGSRIRTTPAVSKNTVVFGTMNGYAYALHADKGALKWKFETKGASQKFEDFENDVTSVFCSPAIGDGIVAIGGRDGVLHAIDLETGKKRWSYDHTPPWILSTAINDGTVFVGCGSNFVVQALDAATGVERWRLKTRGAIYSSPTLVGQMMYFTDRSGDLHALDSRNGSEKWRFPMGTKSFSTPLVSGGMVYCSSDEGIMYGLQGAATADTSTIAVRRAVYWEGAKSDTSYRWFTTEIDRWIRDYFVSAGYEPLTPETLPKFLQEQTRKPTASVVVFADNVVPVSVVEKESKDCLLRKYLDAGGKVVFIGENPLTIKRDSVTGVFRNEDYSIPEKIFDIRYPARNIDAGYYASTPTQEGKQWGFNNFWIGVNSIAPSEATTVLAKNEFGMATAWVKNYGGKKGTGLVQLWIPNEEAVGDIIYSIRMAVEYGLMW